MARPARSGEPVYNHEPERRVTLRYPFTVGGSKIEALPLNPPPFRDLQYLRAKDLVDGADVLAVMSGLPIEIVGAMRWTDIAAALDQAFDLLPPELVDVLKGGGENRQATDEPSDAALPAADAGEVIDLEAPGDDPGPLSSFFD